MENNTTREENGGIGQRLREFRRSCVGRSTQKDFADTLHIDQQRLSGYENGTRVPHQVIAAFVRLGANPYWLLFGDGPMRGTAPVDEGVRDLIVRAIDVNGLAPTERQLAEFYILPLYTDEIAAGTARDMRDTEIEGPAIIHRVWCPNPDQTDYVRVHSTGRSMEPTIPAGAIVTIDRSEIDPERLLNRVVALGLREGGVTLKRLQRNGRGGYVGVPDNSSPEHSIITLGEGDRIVGLVQTVHARLP